MPEASGIQQDDWSHMETLLGAVVAAVSAERARGRKGNATEEGRSESWGASVSLPPIFTEPQNEDRSSDRRNVLWSPENILVDTVARLQQDLAYIWAGGADPSAGCVYDHQSATIWRNDPLAAVSAGV